jgi:hypothetical protein
MPVSLHLLGLTAVVGLLTEPPCKRSILFGNLLDGGPGLSVDRAVVEAMLAG